METIIDMHNCNLPMVDRPVILSGSFNPLHEGHKKLLEVACDISKRPGFLEISIDNYDKGPVTDLNERLARIDTHAVVVTNCSLFIHKAKLFPNAWFVVGYDTLKRIFNPMQSDINNAVDIFKKYNIKFLAAGRSHGDVFYNVSNSAVYKKHYELIIPITEDQYRVDISSTQIRNGEVNEIN